MGESRNAHALADITRTTRWITVYFSATELGGARRVPVAGFPKHLVFYQSYPDEIVVLRIVHGARDLESLFPV
jgi:hypothetical protein